MTTTIEATIANGPSTLLLQRGRRALRKIDVSCWEEASETWNILRDSKKWKSSTAPEALLIRDGVVVAHVSYNGRVWQGTERESVENGTSKDRMLCESQYADEAQTTNTETKEEPMATTKSTTTRKKKRATKKKSTSKRATSAKPAAKKKTTRKARTKKTDATKETSSAIVRRIAEANPDAGHMEICRMAVAEGVKLNTARGALVRIRKSA